MAGRARCSSSSFRNDPSRPYSLDDPKRCCTSCWFGFKFFSPRRRGRFKREGMQLVPCEMAVQSSTENESLALDILTQVAILPPVMCAPPPSPVSCSGAGQNLSLHMPPVTLLTMFQENLEELGNQSELRCDAISTDAHFGFFMLDSALVTPPLYSNLTSASVTPLSTAPFTPPPELAHLTNPPSPEVPFAQLHVPSSQPHGSLSEKVYEHLSVKSLPPIHQLHPGMAICHFGAAESGVSNPETILPLVLEREKGTHDNELVKDRSVAVFENTSFEGFGPTFFKSMCEKPIIMKQDLHQNDKLHGLLKKNDADSPIIVHDNCKNNFLQERQHHEEGCLKCGELSAKCEDLSEALEQTKKKLTLVERRVNLINERERKFRQLKQWMHIGGKLQQKESVEPLDGSSWQGAVFAEKLAESSISIPNIEEDDR